MTLKGEPWFVATDVCKVLGLNLAGGTGNHTRKLGDDEKRVVPNGLIHGKGMAQAVILSESGLYKLIMRSDKPEAKKFQDWVTKVVLPAIRKDGAYVMGEEQMATGELSEDEFVMKAMTILQNKVERLKLENKQMKTVIGTHEHDLMRFARTLDGVNAMQVKASLLKLGYFYRSARTGNTYRVYRKFSHLFIEKINDFNGQVAIFLTEEGKVLLTKLFDERKLVMKKGY